jgi:hypothetical protein
VPCGQLIQFLDLAIDQLNPVQMLAQQFLMDIFHGAGQRIHQCRTSALQILIAQRRQCLRIGLPLRQGAQDSLPLAPSRSVMTEDNLIRPSSRRLSI